MERVFADTGYWIALLNRRDNLHQKATEITGQFGAVEIVTSEMVLAEFLNSFSSYGSRLREAAAMATESLRASGVVVIPQTSRLFARALRRYREMADKNWSLTDCASFVIMQDRQIVAALTHDRHFSQAGFQTLLR